MFKFQHTAVSSLTRESVAVSWSYITDVDPVIFRVSRSESPLEGFEFLPGFVSSSSDSEYIDRNPAQFHEFRSFYYKVTAVDPSTELELVSSGPVRDESPRDLVALEIIRRQSLYLRKMVGAPVFLCIARSYGVRCSCWDSVKKRSTRSQCAECYGTTYRGGFFDPIPTFMAREPDDKNVQISEFGELQSDETTAWVCPFPAVKPRDILISTSDRWRVVNTRDVHHKGSVVMQIIRLTKIHRSDIEHDLVAPTFSEFSENDIIHRAYGGSSGDYQHLVTEKGQITLAGYDPSTHPGLVKADLDGQDLTLGT